MQRLIGKNSSHFCMGKDSKYISHFAQNCKEAPCIFTSLKEIYRSDWCLPANQYGEMFERKIWLIERYAAFLQCIFGMWWSTWEVCQIARLFLIPLSSGGTNINTTKPLGDSLKTAWKTSVTIKLLAIKFQSYPSLKGQNRVPQNNYCWCFLSLPEIVEFSCAVSNLSQKYLNISE